jgi:hypothetical protein
MYCPLLQPVTENNRRAKRLLQKLRNPTIFRLPGARLDRAAAAAPVAAAAAVFAAAAAPVAAAAVLEAAALL